MKESIYQQHAIIINGYAQYMSLEAAVAKYKRTNLGRLDFIIDQVAARILAEAPPAEPVVEFEHAQEIVVVAGNHAGKSGWFNKVSGRGGRGEYCFIWFKTANMTGAQVKMSEIAPVGGAPTPTTKKDADVVESAAAQEGGAAAADAGTVTTYALIEPVAVLPDELLELTIIAGEVVAVAVVRAAKGEKMVATDTSARLLHDCKQRQTSTRMSAKNMRKAIAAAFAHKEDKSAPRGYGRKLPAGYIRRATDHSARKAREQRASYAKAQEVELAAGRQVTAAVDAMILAIGQDASDETKWNEIGFDDVVVLRHKYAITALDCFVIWFLVNSGALIEVGTTMLTLTEKGVKHYSILKDKNNLP